MLWEHVFMETNWIVGLYRSPNCKYLVFAHCSCIHWKWLLLGEWAGFHGWQRGVVGKLPAHCEMHFMCNKYIKAENCHTMMHGTAVGVAEAVDTPLLQQPFRNTHRDFYPHLWLYMYTGNFPNHFFFTTLCRAMRAAKTRKKGIMQNSSLSDFYLWAPLDRAWKWMRWPGQSGRAPTESHRINRFPAINQNYGGDSRFLFALALQPCWLNWW